MNNITKYKGQRIKDRYKDGAEKLYALCDYINKRAMIWYALNIEFSEEEVGIIKIIQQTMEDMKAISKKVDEDENIYDYIDLGYEVYRQTCPKCKGKVYVMEFAVNELGHDFNVYKCLDCGEETQDEYPNKPEHVKIYFEYQYKILDVALLSETMSEEAKLPFRVILADMQKTEKWLMDINEEVIKSNEAVKKAVLASIEANGGMYKELYKNKHHFDRNIGEA